MSSSDQVDVTVLMTAHKERTLAHHTLRALRRCVQHALENDVTVEVVVVLDSPDRATEDFMAEAMGPQGYFTGLCEATLIPTQVRSPGLARNIGVVAASSRYVAVVDADNLPTANWLTEGVRVLARTNGQAIVHPEYIITFDKRSEIWPQWSDDDERFNLANLYDCNYWDTVCIAHREVFERFPYSATGPNGFGYEDWHFYANTLAAGIPHLTAAETAYFYRIKRYGSVFSEQSAQASVIPQTALLTDDALAKQFAEASPEARIKRPRVRTPQTRAVLRAWRANEAPTPTAQAPRLRERLSRSSRQDERAQSREGRRPGLTAWDVAALAPAFFDAAHYRLLHADLATLGDDDVIRHYLDQGRREGRRALLSASELAALAKLDVEDYLNDNPDLQHMSHDGLVAHYLTHGRAEGRRAHISSSERAARVPRELPAGLLAEWRSLHSLEPLIPIPTPQELKQHRIIGPPADGSTTLASRVWWRTINALEGARPRVIIFAPWLRMGGADRLVARYAQTITELRPDWEIVVITTHSRSTTQHWMPEAGRLLELPEIQGYRKLTSTQKAELTVNLAVQLKPELVHIINSPEAFDGFEWSSRAITNASRAHLTTFVIERGAHGEIQSHFAKRRPGYLDDAEGVIVDSHALVDQLHELYRFPREKFHVHHQAIALPPRQEPRPRDAGDPIKVLWAARFDRQKRLDVLADIAEAAAIEGIPVDWHVFGGAVLDSPDDTEAALERLAASGAVLHGLYSADNPLDFHAYDAFLITSESEGIPLTLLDVMAARLPVIAASVGGIPELIDATTGFPIDDHEDVPAYLEALRTLVSSPSTGWALADAGYDRLAADFSWEAFKRQTEDTPGYLTAPGVDLPRVRE